MDIVGVFEAKTKLSELLDRVAAGAEVTITRHGVPVAKLVPAAAARMTPAEAVDALLKLREGIRLNGPGQEKLTIRELIDHGRR